MRKPDKNSGIPLPVIILGYILSVPAGIVLTILHLFSVNKDKDSSAETEKTEEKVSRAGVSSGKTVSSETEKSNKTVENKTERSGICVPSLVLSIISAVFLLCGLLNLADGIFSMPFDAFLKADYISATVMLLILSASCFLPAQFFRCRHDRRNVIRSIIGRRESILLRQLAAAADMRPKKLRKELQAMIDNGDFGDEAFIDLSTGRFLRHPDETEEIPVKKAEKPQKTEVQNADEPDEFRAIILQIRKLNDEIKDYAVSERIYRIEEHTQNIFDYVTEHPEAMPQIRSFMNYYLPTTLKLLASYSRIEQVGVAGENMKKSKENIERTLDMLVVGFEQQVDKLFRSESIDISSEITVLEAMMKQDGLDGRNDFDTGYDPGYTDDLSAGLGSGSAAAQYPPKTTE